MIRTMNTKRWHSPATVSLLDEDNEPIRAAFETLDDAFYAAAKEQVMSDCSGVHHIRVHHAGRTFRYAGWQPDMLVEFVNEFGTTVWSQNLYEYDH